METPDLPSPDTIPPIPDATPPIAERARPETDDDAEAKAEAKRAKDRERKAKSRASQKKTEPQKGPGIKPKKGERRTRTAVTPVETSASEQRLPGPLGEMSNEALAGMLVASIDMVAVTLGKFAFGDRGVEMSADDASKEEMRKAAAAYLATVEWSPTPLETFGIAVGLAYVPSAVSIAMSDRGGGEESAAFVQPPPAPSKVKVADAVAS